MSPPRALVLQHADHAPPGQVGRWLAEAGLELDVLRPYTGDPVPDRINHDALVVFGGPMGADDDADHPWLTAEKRLLGRACADGVPTLGICLGHQLLAVATGGRVQPNPAGKQAGLHHIGLRPGAGADPLFGGFTADPVAVQWNDDIVVAMAPAVQLIAATPDGVPQAMRCGERAWGVQFHPEVGASTVLDWAERAIAQGRLQPAVAKAHVADVERDEEVLAATWRPWTERFAQVVRECHAARRRGASWSLP